MTREKPAARGVEPAAFRWARLAGKQVAAAAAALLSSVLASVSQSVSRRSISSRTNPMMILDLSAPQR